MTDLMIALILASMFVGMVGIGIINVVSLLIERKKAKKPLFTSINDEAQTGEKRHCDGYHAGNFYW